MSSLRTACSSLRLPLAGALVIAAMTAAGAQAQIHPNDTTITGTAENPTFDYAGTIVVCDTGTAVGETGVGLGHVNLELDFFGNCNLNGLGITITCSEATDDDEEDGDKNPIGTARLQALTGDRGPSLPEDGELDRLNQGFFCQFTWPGVCTITFAEQDLPISGGVNEADYLNEPADPRTDPSGQIDVDLDARATRLGSSLCGPTTGVMGLTAIYDLGPDAPNSVTFD